MAVDHIIDNLKKSKKKKKREIMYKCLLFFIDTLVLNSQAIGVSAVFRVCVVEYITQTTDIKKALLAYKQMP